ncbi:hypothetical protein [Inquilinus limosus]|uniref:Uncharacterized protein n=1 Tax=Inquilinus limosus MP06 TaxID=1398085 RepID=A0A0A0DE22_9PROT|nr:hypothetical protein [Inquilinus limosus]KGM36148.1 hypothetical protein P409_00435 [Inquilinus limosus MP06]
MITYTMGDVDAALRAIFGPHYDPHDRTIHMDRAAARCFVEQRPEDRHTQVLRAALTHLRKTGVILPEDVR